MSHPKSFEELAAFLAKHPNITVETPGGKLSPYHFTRYNGEVLSFSAGSSMQITYPVKVGEFHFYEDRFERRVFSRVEKFYYSEKKRMPSIEAEWDELLPQCKFK